MSAKVVDSGRTGTPAERAASDGTKDSKLNASEVASENGANVATSEATDASVWNALNSRIPTDENGNLMSVGSIFHSQGRCKPCRFHSHPTKPEGCQYGVGCLFCHFPHDRRRRRGGATAKERQAPRDASNGPQQASNQQRQRQPQAGGRNRPPRDGSRPHPHGVPPPPPPCGITGASPQLSFHLPPLCCPISPQQSPGPLPNAYQAAAVDAHAAYFAPGRQFIAQQGFTHPNPSPQPNLHLPQGPFHNTQYLSQPLQAASLGNMGASGATHAGSYGSAVVRSSLATPSGSPMAMSREEDLVAALAAADCAQHDAQLQSLRQQYVTQGTADAFGGFGSPQLSGLGHGMHGFGGAHTPLRRDLDFSEYEDKQQRSRVETGALHEAFSSLLTQSLSSEALFHSSNDGSWMRDDYAPGLSKQMSLGGMYATTSNRGDQSPLVGQPFLKQSVTLGTAPLLASLLSNSTACPTPRLTAAASSGSAAPASPPLGASAGPNRPAAVSAVSSTACETPPRAPNSWSPMTQATASSLSVDADVGVAGSKQFIAADVAGSHYAPALTTTADGAEFDAELLVATLREMSLGQ